MTNKVVHCDAHHASGGAFTHRVGMTSPSSSESSSSLQIRPEISREVARFRSESLFSKYRVDSSNLNHDVDRSCLRWAAAVTAADQYSESRRQMDRASLLVMLMSLVRGQRPVAGFANPATVRHSCRKSQTNNSLLSTAERTFFEPESSPRLFRLMTRSSRPPLRSAYLADFFNKASFRN